MNEWEHLVCLCVCTVYRRRFVVVVFDEDFSFTVVPDKVNDGSAKQQTKD